MFIENRLYEKIRKLLPIPCVDLVIVNDQGKILLAKRNNEPALGEWWFPGGRIHYLETRLAAVGRKLQEECGIEAGLREELGTFDVMVARSDNGNQIHAVTTVYMVRIASLPVINLDAQHSEVKWLLPVDWLNLQIHPFVANVLSKLV